MLQANCQGTRKTIYRSMDAYELRYIKQIAILARCQIAEINGHRHRSVRYRTIGLYTRRGLLYASVQWRLWSLSSV